MKTRILVLAAGNERGGAASHIAILADSIVAAGRQAQFVFVLVHDGPLAEKLQAAGVNTVILNGSPVHIVKQLRRLLTDTENEGTILHSHGPRLNVLAYAASKGLPVQWVSTIHSHIFKDFLSSRTKTLLFTRLNRWCLSKSDGLFVVHPMFDMWFRKHPVFYVPNGISMEPLEHPNTYYRALLRDAIDVALETKLFGIAARFDVVKDIPTIVRALDAMEDKTAHLVIAGDGEQRTALEQLVNDLGLGSRVHFLGFISQVREFYAGLDIHVLASHSEGTPFSVLEAGLARVPNVGTDIPGITRLVTDGKTGRCFPVGDWTRLAGILDDLLNEEKQREQLAANFAEQVLPEYTPEKMLNAYVRGYNILEGAQEPAEA